VNGILDHLKDPAQAKQLSQALDLLEQAATARAANNKPGEQGKTVGDALDKGLDMARDTVVYLAGKIEQVAPQLWRVLIVQQYVKGATGLISPVGFLILVFFYRRLLLKWWRPQPGDDDANEPLLNATTRVDEIPTPTHRGWRGFLSIMVPLAAIVIGGISFYSALTDAVGYFINPNYYALKDIIILVKNPGAF
jgi:hypothetical protein